MDSHSSFVLLGRNAALIRQKLDSRNSLTIYEWFKTRKGRGIREGQPETTNYLLGTEFTQGDVVDWLSHVTVECIGDMEVKGRIRYFTKPPPVQGMFQPIPGLISYTGVTWRSTDWNSCRHLYENCSNAHKNLTVTPDSTAGTSLISVPSCIAFSPSVPESSSLEDREREKMNNTITVC